jgi:hypothetical protein
LSSFINCHDFGRILAFMHQSRAIAADSYDVFDTLIARRCIEPWRIFEEVGRIVGAPGFTAARLSAEASLSGRDYSLDDIYAALGAQVPLPKETCEALKSLEISTELSQVVPIAENQARVRHGDLLISDMYLPPAVIRRLLAATGFDKRVGLVVSTGGKRSGQIWPRIAPQVTIGRHLGDCPIADDAMPDRHGVRSERTALSAPSEIEQWLIGENLRPLALFVREARLRSHHEDPLLRGLQRIQIEINLPILLLSTIQLCRVASAIGADRLLFCSRDCDLWLELYRVMAPIAGAHFEGEYYYTSRIARTAGSADTLAYSRACLGERALVVDACGTGWSLSHLFEKLGMRGRHAFFIHHCAPLAMYEHKAPTPQNCTIHTAMHPAEPIANVAIEMVNTAEHGSVVDVRDIAGTFVPVLADGWCERVRAAVRTGRGAFLDALRCLPQHDLRPLLDLPPDRIASLVETLYRHLGTRAELHVAFLDAFCRETREVHKTLEIPLP